MEVEKTGECLEVEITEMGEIQIKKIAQHLNQAK